MERVLIWLIGSMVGWILGWIVAAWGAVAGVVHGYLTARRPTIDPHLEVLARWRSVVGLLLVVAANIVWNPDPTRLMLAWSDSMGRAMLLPLQIAVAVLIGALLLTVIAQRGHRRRMLRATMRPTRVVGVSLLVLAGWVGSIVGWTQLMPFVANTGEWMPLAVFGMLTANVALTFVGLVGFFHGSRAIARDCFRARDGHPGMRAVVIVVLSLWTLGVGIFEMATSGADGVFPLWASLCLLVAGPLANIALSAHEISRLHRLFGISLRRAIDE